MATKFEKLIDFQELSLYNDKLKTYIAGLLTGYVVTEEGKGLSSNDFTDILAAKLEGIAEGAEPNVQADWNATTGDAAILNKPEIPKNVMDVGNKLDKVGDGSAVTVAATAAAARANLTTGETLSVMVGKLMKWYSDLSAAAWSGSYDDLTGTPTIPTDNKNLTNGAGYQTENNVKTIVESYKYQTADEVASAIVKALQGEFKYVDALPETGEVGYIYLVPDANGKDQNMKIEYVWVSATNTWEEVGRSQMSLDGYLKETDVSLATNDDINGLFN